MHIWWMRVCSCGGFATANHNIHLMKTKHYDCDIWFHDAATNIIRKIHLDW